MSPNKKQTDMKNLFQLFIAILLLACSSVCYAQQSSQRTIRAVGYVVDSFLDVGIPKTKVFLMTKDSVVVDSTVVQKRTPNGKVVYTEYSFNVPAKKATYIIKAEADNYQTGYIPFTLKYVGRNVRIDVPTLKLKRLKRKAYGLDEENALEEVVVKATKIKMYYKGDTVVYNADAFNLPEGSMLDGLIKQLPGATLNENGEIRINGRKIDYLSFNGKKLFDGKNQLIISNLPYYTVKNLKVFEKDQETDAALGQESRVKDYVMDVALKKEYSKRNFLAATLGMGTQDRVLARVFDSFFSDRWGGIAYGNLNNLNQTRTPGWDGSFSEAVSPKSNIENKQFGMSGQFEGNQGRLSDEISISGSIKDTEIDMQQQQEFFLANGNVNKYVNEQSDRRISNFNFSNRFQLMKPFVLKANTKVEYDDGKEDATNHSETLRNILANQATVITGMTNHSLRLYQDLGYATLMPWGDRLGIQAKASYETGREHSKEQQRIVYPKMDVDSLYEFLANEKVKRQVYDYSVDALYQIELLSGKRLRLGYQYEQADESKDRFRLKNEYSDNSYHANTLHRYHKPNVAIDFQRGGWFAMLELMVSLQSDKMSYQRTDMSTALTRNYVDWKPKFMMIGNFPSSHLEFNSSYDSSSKPSVTDLVGVRDDSNPLLITLGNSDLKKESVWHSDFQYNYNNRSKGFSLDMTSNVDIRFNNIVRSYLYDEQGGSYTLCPENVKGNWSAGMWVKVEIPLDKTKAWRFRNDVNYDFSHKIGLSGTSATGILRNVINSHAIGDDVKLTFQYKKLTIAALGGVKYQGSRCDTNDNMNYNAYDIHYGINMNCPLFWKIQLAGDLTMYQRKGYELESINRDNLIGNVSLNRSFAKGKLLVSLIAYDVFHQLSSIERAISDQSNSETTYNCIPRYGMISVTYKFGKQ